MNHKLKRKWVAALRSGAYKQFRGGWFRRGEKEFCALGVLRYKVEGFDLYRDSMTEMLGKEAFDAIYKMNDSEEKTLPEIADWIEENI